MFENLERGKRQRKVGIERRCGDATGNNKMCKKKKQTNKIKAEYIR